MRVPARANALAALVLSAWINAPATADTAAARFDTGHPFVVVTFANDPYRPAARAGTTGRRYTGGGAYTVAQSAHNNAQRVAAAYSLRQVASWPIKELGVHCVVYEIPDSRPVLEVLAALSKDPRVTLAQPLQQFHTLTEPAHPLTGEPAVADSAQAQMSEPTAADANNPPARPAYNDPLYALQTNLVSLGISAAHQRAQGAGVRVALIDTGVDSRHPDLRDRIAATRSFVSDNSPTRAVAGSYRHGTAMAGLIAAVANNAVGIVGIAPLARIEVFEACWQLEPNMDAAACNTFTLAQALAAALEAHVPLINLSIAGPADPLLAALVQSGLKRGVIFVGSLADEADSFPTNIAGVIGVANSEGSRLAAVHGPEGSHGGTTAGAARLAAPATHVLTLHPDSQYDFESGTSVAAAEVTGVVALLLSVNSHLTSDSIVTLLKDGATQPGSIDVNGALAKLEAARGRLARSPH